MRRRKKFTGKATVFLTTMLTLTVAVSLCAKAWAAGDLVAFPTDHADGVLYTTVYRGNIKEDIYTDRRAIEAVKEGQPIPSGTVITLVDYRDGELYRYVVMERRSGWGTEYPAEVRNGEWEYQAFRADRSVNEQEDLLRCFRCHKSQEETDFVFTFGQMKSAE